jgi:hypothetical protein
MIQIKPQISDLLKSFKYLNLTATALYCICLLNTKTWNVKNSVLVFHVLVELIIARTTRLAVTSRHTMLQATKISDYVFMLHRQCCVTVYYFYLFFHSSACVVTLLNVSTCTSNFALPAENPRTAYASVNLLSCALPYRCNYDQIN